MGPDQRDAGERAGAMMATFRSLRAPASMSGRVRKPPCGMKTLAAHALLALSLCVASAHAEAPADLRVAIVIGNAAYADAPIANAGREAQAVGTALKTMGFQVIEAHDATREQMVAAIARAEGELKGHNGVGLFYYAGDGLQLDWHNYMVPVDSRLSRASQVPAQTVDVEDIAVPAGAFKAHRVQSHGEARRPGGPITFVTRTTWIDPKTMVVLRNDVLLQMNGRITASESERLVAFERATR